MVNYLNNKDILKEIHKSKCSFCQFDDVIYKDFNEIIEDIKVLTDNTVCSEHYGTWEVKYTIAGDSEIICKTIDKLWRFKNSKQFSTIKLLSNTLVSPMSCQDFIAKVKQETVYKINYPNIVHNNKKKNKDNQLPVISESEILTGDLVFRHMTYEHIPLDPNWSAKRIKKFIWHGYMPINFPPFKHYVMRNGVPMLVGLSHYKDGEFSVNHGKVTDNLGRKYLMLTSKISQKPNFRGYSYLDDMISAAIMQLCENGLKFNEARGDNPFAFYTTVVVNSFKRVLNIEKKVRTLRDDLIENQNMSPSYTRQFENDVKTYNKKKEK